MNDGLFMLIIFILSLSVIYVHEFGHYIYAKRYGNNVKVIYRKIFNFNLYPKAISYEFDETKLSITKRRIVTLGGICFGIIPIFFMIYLSFIINERIFGMVILVMYIGICFADITQLIYPNKEIVVR